MLNRRPIILAILTSACLMAAILCMNAYATAAMAAPTGAHAVSLTDAHRAPTDMLMLPSGGTVMVGTCVPSDISAYRWDGSALSAQQRTSRGYYWRTGTGRVTYSKATQRFHNGSRQPVLVASWCER